MVVPDLQRQILVVAMEATALYVIFPFAFSIDEP